MAIQPRSTVTNGVENGEAQGRLPLAPRAKQMDVPHEYIERRHTLLGAINLCIDLSGVDDKEICLALEIDPGHWSNIRKNKPGVHFPTDKLNGLMSLCGNLAPLDWLAWSNGYGLVLLKTEAERRADEAEKALEEERAKTKMLTDILKGSAP